MLVPSPSAITVPGSRVQVIFGPGQLNRLGDIAKSQRASRILLVTDKGISDAGHAERAVRSLYRAGLVVHVYDEVGENPTTKHVDGALLVAQRHKPDFIVGLGGGSSMDCAKGANFLYSNGGRMQDYWGVNKAPNPMLPMIAIPTTAGTGSDAQSFALITDPETHQKMACGDTKALPRLAILDPELTATQPPKVAAATGIDAVAHAVESSATTKRNDTSRALSRQAWDLLSTSFEKAVSHPLESEDARRNMLLGAHLAGAAIENSMLGAAHACANPLTAKFGIVHGLAVGLMLPWVVRFNAQSNGNPYADLADPEALAKRIEHLLSAANLPRRLTEVAVTESDLPDLAENAATQWTATFNPRKVGEPELLQIYRSAL